LIDYNHIIILIIHALVSFYHQFNLIATSVCQFHRFQYNLCQKSQPWARAQLFGSKDAQTSCALQTYITGSNTRWSLDQGLWWPCSQAILSWLHPRKPRGNTLSLDSFSLGARFERQSVTSGFPRMSWLPFREAWGNLLFSEKMRL